MDSRLPSHQYAPSSSTSNEGYFTREALRAGILIKSYGGTPDSDLDKRSVDLDPAIRDSVQREFEKEKIVQDVISAEIHRLKLQQSAAFERDLILRCGMLPPPPPHPQDAVRILVPQEGLPFRHPRVDAVRGPGPYML